MRQNAIKHGAKTAVVFEGKTLSWKDLWEQVQSASGALSSHLGDRDQEIVAIIAPNSPEFIISYLAVVHAGHIALPLDISFKRLEIDSVLNKVKPALVLARQDFTGVTGFKSLPIEGLLSDGAADKAVRPKLPPEQQVATLFLSSGTTGQPKAIPNTHANILWDIEAIAKPMGWSREDTLLMTLHLSHRHGLVICLLGALYHGNTVYLEERFNPSKTLEMLESGTISLYSAVPSIYESLVEYEPHENFDLSRVRLFASSSSALPPYLRQAFERRFGRQILDRYGTSETGSIAVIPAEAKDSFAEPLPGVDVRLEASGEVALKSPGLFPGYFHNPEATRQNLTDDGWWLTGDTGELKDGHLKLKGRSKERISKSGYSIYPQDIEWALSQNPKIDEVKVIGLPSAGKIDDKILAFYAGSVGESPLIDYSKTNLPRSWRPDRFVRLNELPKTPNGKVQITKLRELAEAKRG